MPYLINQKLFFVHIPKTAGSSIERAFGVHPSCNKTTSNSSASLRSSPSLANDVLRKTINLGLGFFASSSKRKEKNNFLIGYDQPSLVLQHLTLSEMFWLGYLSQDELSKSTFFSVVRHPKDRIISAWRSHQRHVEFPDINDFIESRLNSLSCTTHDERAHIRPMSHYLDISNLPCPIRLHVLRLETIQTCWSSFGERVLGDPSINLRSWPSLPHYGSNRSHVSPVSNQSLSAKSADLIKRYYSCDYENFAYQ